LARIYTKTGDKGETGLVGGLRVSKDSPRVRAYGDVDELNSVLGLARAFTRDTEIDTSLEGLQRDLFSIGANLASTNQGHGLPSISKNMVVTLEEAIDRFQSQLSPLTAFILPGGSETGALLHFARTVARRAERNIVALSKTERVSENLVPYMNRLSDLLFVLARLANHREGREEMEWHKSAETRN
jgi:cob(I)alamin adenosyltransferase